MACLTCGCACRGVGPRVIPDARPADPRGPMVPKVERREDVTAQERAVYSTFVDGMFVDGMRR